MSVYEDFTSMMEMEGWDSPAGIMTLSDDQQHVYSLADDKPQLESRGLDVFNDVFDAPMAGDPLSEDWMEKTSLTQMLEELTGMAMGNYVPTDADAKPDLQTLDDVEVPVDMGLDGFELLEQLVVKAEELNSFAPEPSDTSVVKLQQVSPIISLDDSGISSIDNSFSDNISNVSTIDLTEMDDVMHSPLSASDVDSLLSSPPASPSTTLCNTELFKLMTQPTPSHLTVSKSTSTKSISPGSSNVRKSKVKSVSKEGLEMEFLSKKEKKKLQNKNAAIRYRQKKKVESDEIKRDESELETVNKQLKDKVEELQREILYMKNLMSEVYKARELGGVKITKVTV